MPTVGEQLRVARQARGISIAEIAAATRINAQYLEDLENDRQPKLPPVYARTFLRSFASAVGLDPDAIAVPPAPAQPSPPASAGEGPSPPPPQQAVRSAPRLPRQTPVPIKQHQVRSLVILSIIILVGLAVSIIALQHQENRQPVREVPFADVIKERDSVPVRPTADTAHASRAVAPKEAIDSLHLEAVSVETVWVRVVIDSILTREYTLAPQHRISWKAAESFRVSVGNASGIYFSLNGKHLGTLGAGKTPVKDLLLTRAALGAGSPSPPSSKKPHEKSPTDG